MTEVEQLFQTHFDTRPDRVVFTPGRVNLIGEHVDYNGGYVLPAALPLGIHVGVKRRTDQRINIASANFDTRISRSLHDPANDHWSDYALGAVTLANQVGMISGGADIAISSTLPYGSGLSSSAALCVGLLQGLNNLSDALLTPVDIARLARRIENEFIGVPCGIMDQMAVALARTRQALALDTHTLEFDFVTLPENYRICVVHSGQTRRLNEGRYRIRKEECDAIKQVAGREDICRMSDQDLRQLPTLPDPLDRRLRHCVSEHRRTVQAIHALRTDNIALFASLMCDSHASMRDDFEITTPIIDDVVDTAIQCGAIGARMTGGGFGGCIVACVPSGHVESWSSRLADQVPESRFICQIV